MGKIGLLFVGVFALSVWFINSTELVVAKQCDSTYKYTTNTTLYHHYAVGDPDGVHNVLVWKIDPVTKEFIKVDPGSNIYVWVPDPVDPTKGELKISKALIGDWKIVVDIIGDDMATDPWQFEQGDPLSYVMICTVGGIAELPEAAESPGGSSSFPFGAMAGIATGGALLLAAGGWYARRRWRAD